MEPTRRQVQLLNRRLRDGGDQPPEFGAAELPLDVQGPYPLSGALHRSRLLHWLDTRSARLAGRHYGQWSAAVLPVLLAAPSLARADAGLALFEWDALLAARLRARGLPGFRRTPIVAVVTRLTEQVKTLTPRQTRRLAAAFRGIDAVIVYSANQIPLLTERLDIAPGRIHTVPFGIDTTWFSPGRVAAPSSSSARIVAAGWDAGRDYDTLVDAVRGTELDVEIMTRRFNIRHLLELPPNVDWVGIRPLPAYRDALAAAEIVVIPLRDIAYPSGSTVLLHAMALGRCCVVTATPALAAYVDPGRTAVVVPVGDAGALRTTLVELLADPARRAAIGQAAQAEVREHFDVARMWARIGRVIDDVVD